jgi:hypothetical protein
LSVNTRINNQFIARGLYGIFYVFFFNMLREAGVYLLGGVWYRGLDWSGAELTEVLFLSLKGNIRAVKREALSAAGGVISHALNALHGVKKGSRALRKSIYQSDATTSHKLS